MHVLSEERKKEKEKRLDSSVCARSYVFITCDQLTYVFDLLKIVDIGLLQL